MDHHPAADPGSHPVLPNSKRALSGTQPPTTMPFDRHGDPAYSALRGQLDFVVAQGAHGKAAIDTAMAGVPLQSNRIEV